MNSPEKKQKIMIQSSTSIWLFNYKTFKSSLCWQSFKELQAKKDSIYYLVLSISVHANLKPRYNMTSWYLFTHFMTFTSTIQYQ
jgi:hypothetical protein